MQKKLFGNGIALFCAIAVAGSGCASTESPKVADDLTSLKKQVWKLNKQVAELNLRVSYNSNDIANLKAAADVSSNETTIKPEPLANNAVKPKATKSVNDSKPQPVSNEIAVRGPVETVERHQKAAPVRVVSVDQQATDEVSLETDAPLVIAQAADIPMVSSPHYSDLDAVDIYRKATLFFNKREYGMAMEGFSYLTRAYPNHPFAPFSQYWIGEIHFIQKRYLYAWEAFEKTLMRWPDSPKAPDAMLKSGLSHLGMRKNREAVMMFTRLVETYPKSAAANNARRKLEEMTEKNNGQKTARMDRGNEKNSN